jgi:hypothetical protein
MAKKTIPAPMLFYTSRGDMGAFLIYPYLFNPIGEWIGWATPKKEIYNLDGSYVGMISSDNRILRKRHIDNQPPKLPLPKAPEKPRPPASIPLPPRMAELPFDQVDVLEELPDLLHTIDSGEFKPDAD